MKARIDPDTGRVKWMGRGGGENWVSVPANLPEQTDSGTVLHYIDGEFLYK